MHANRLSEARALYQAILRESDDEMELSDKTVSSYALARAGIDRLDAATVTAR